MTGNCECESLKSVLYVMNFCVTIVICKWEISREELSMKTLKSNLNPIILSGKLGDGCIYKNNKEQQDYNISFSSINLDYLLYKRDELSKLVKVSNIRTQKLGYKIGAISYMFATHKNNQITNIANLNISECIDALDKLSLVMFYLDDGTYHQRKHFMHLYCNKFTIEETEKLIDKIYSLYPQKRGALRWDVKKDGRRYPYIYIPVKTANEFKKDVEKFLLDNEIYSMLYKVGIDSPSETIENISKEHIASSLERSE